ncbi:damage-inducible protein DinB [Paenibacillus mesophilus]|uniref:DinB family protein n=1 Tax=Paenibacillus mesophilus TaxID=2582849 RepID=UPI00110D2DFB|nr:DinB family protein [Paenibacillus mesophilus]TMV49137.1 damage-inducible protein DinB [Paenibacillus mesophilus]
MKTIQKMYEHLYWANRRILEALQRMEEDNQEVCRLFTHILCAEKVWLTRLQGKDSSSLPIWSDADLEVCAELVEQNEEGFTTLLKGLANTDPDQWLSYKNSKGQEFSNSVRDILTHVALHGQYHRGQINSRLRASGIEPVVLDYILFVR